MILLLCTVLLSNSFAQMTPPQGKSVSIDPAYQADQGAVVTQKRLVNNEVKPLEKVEFSEKSKNKSSLKIHKSSAVYQGNPGNLPTYYSGIDRSGMHSSDKVVFVPSNTGVKLSGVKSGDIFFAVIEQEIKASPNVPTPLVARVINGTLKGGLFVGEAILDKDLKRILINFNKVRTDRSQIYSVKAQGLSIKGSVGLEGEYSSNSGKFFLAELGSVTAAGVVDSTINRQQTVNGGYVQEPSLSNSAKTGAVSALSRTADRMAESARQAPEYTFVEGYQKIQVIVQDDPTEIY